MLNEPNACWNTVYRVIFHYNKWKSVEAFIDGLSQIKFFIYFYVGRVNFYRYLLNVCNSALNNLLCRDLADNYCNDSCLKSLFLSRCECFELLSFKIC